MRTDRSQTLGAAGGPSAQGAFDGVLQRYWLIFPLVVATGVLALDPDLPVLRPILAIGTLLVLPTTLLYRRLRLPSDSGVSRVTCAFGMVLLALILGTLALNVTLPLVGVDRPLQPLVLARAALVANLVLLGWRAEPVPWAPADWSVLRQRLVNARVESAQMLAVASLVVAVVGAVRLNNGAGGQLAVLGHVLAAAAMLALLTKAAGPVGRDARVVGLVALSLLLATSLRGWFITGHDIQAEYLAFTLTNEQQHWQMSALQNAYNACLSVNILPTVLAQTTGLSGVVVFKVVLQAVFALVPVLTFVFARRFLTRRLALVATLFTMAFPTFFTDMPYLVRQEIAFFFLALMLVAGTEPDRRGVRSRLLVGFFGVGVVLSHYSTTYVLLMVLVIGLATLLALRLWQRRRQGDQVTDPHRTTMLLLSPVLVLFLAVASLAWTGPATHTGGQATKVLGQTVKTLTGRGGDTPGSSDLSFSLFSGSKTSPRDRLDLYVKKTLEARRQVPASDLLVRRPGPAELRPAIVPSSKTALTSVGRAMDKHGLAPSSFNAGLRIVAAGVMQLFLIVGLAWIVLRRRSSPTGRPLPVELVCLSLGAVGALGLIVLIPSLSVDYGVLRVFQQALLIVAPVMTIGLWVLVRPLGTRALALCALVPAALLLTLSGVVPSLVGAYSAQLALSNSGLYYDRYYPAASDVHGVKWLVDTGAAPEGRVISNKTLGTQLFAATGGKAHVADRLYPTLLTKGAYVLIDSHTLKDRQATVFYTGDLITYAYPLQDLDHRLDLVYTSQDTRIYR